jgi:hypothetical protein
LPFATTPFAEDGMTTDRALAFSIGLAAIATGGAGPAMAQACSREGAVVSCDDGRRGLLSGDAIIRPGGTQSSLSPHPSVRIGNKVRARSVTKPRLRAEVGSHRRWDPVEGAASRVRPC